MYIIILYFLFLITSYIKDYIIMSFFLSIKYIFKNNLTLKL